MPRIKPEDKKVIYDIIKLAVEGRSTFDSVKACADSQVKLLQREINTLKKYLFDPYYCEAAVWDLEVKIDLKVEGPEELMKKLQKIQDAIDSKVATEARELIIKSKKKGYDLRKMSPAQLHLLKQKIKEDLFRLTHQNQSVVSERFSWLQGQFQEIPTLKVLITNIEKVIELVNGTIIPEKLSANKSIYDFYPKRMKVEELEDIFNKLKTLVDKGKKQSENKDIGLSKTELELKNIQDIITAKDPDKSKNFSVTEPETFSFSSKSKEDTKSIMKVQDSKEDSKEGEKEKKQKTVGFTKETVDNEKPAPSSLRPGFAVKAAEKWDSYYKTTPASSSVSAATAVDSLSSSPNSASAATAAGLFKLGTDKSAKQDKKPKTSEPKSDAQDTAPQPSKRR